MPESTWESASACNDSLFAERKMLKVLQDRDREHCLSTLAKMRSNQASPRTLLRGGVDAARRPLLQRIRHHLHKQKGAVSTSACNSHVACFAVSAPVQLAQATACCITCIPHHS